MLIYNKRIIFLLFLFLCTFFVLGIWLPIQFKNKSLHSWEVNIAPRGQIQVFGLILGKSTVKEAESKLNLQNKAFGKIYFSLSSVPSEQLTLLLQGTELDIHEISKSEENKSQAIQSVVFIPSNHLSKHMLLTHFGVPKLHFRLGKYNHFIYPQMGIDLLEDEQGKLVVYYFQPKVLTLLVAWLDKDLKNLA